jgi:hypothetical protein
LTEADIERIIREMYVETTDGPPWSDQTSDRLPEANLPLMTSDCDDENGIEDLFVVAAN